MEDLFVMSLCPHVGLRPRVVGMCGPSCDVPVPVQRLRLG